MRIKSRSKSNCLIDIYNFQTTVEGNADSFNGELKKLTDFAVRIVKNCPDMPTDAGSGYYLLINVPAFGKTMQKSAALQILLPYAGSTAGIYIRNGRVDHEGTDSESYYMFYDWRKVSINSLGGGGLKTVLRLSGRFLREESQERKWNSYPEGRLRCWLFRYIKKRIRGGHYEQSCWNQYYTDRPEWTGYCPDSIGIWRKSLFGRIHMHRWEVDRPWKGVPELTLGGAAR